MTSSRSSPSREGPGSPSPAADSDRKTHSTHIFDVPYRRAPEAKPQQKPQNTHSDKSSSSLTFSPSNTINKAKDQPKITPIPRIVPSSTLSTEPTTKTATTAPTERKKLTQRELAKGLEGRFVDEFGNVLDWDGTVLGRVEGDLPSMVGRPVSDSGEIIDTDGEVAGYVCDNYILPERKQLGGGLEFDDEGNIYNKDGAVVGKLNELPPKEEEKEEKPSSSASSSQQDTGTNNGASEAKACSCSAPKPASAPNPSEIYLDVKSTFDGIQLIIKIPTIFNRDHEGAEQEKEFNAKEKEKYDRVYEEHDQQ